MLGYAPRYRPYNFAYSGYGPQNVLARLLETEWTAGIEETTGVAFYVFWDSHVDRAIGAYSVARGHGKHFPYYVKRKGRLVRGSFSEVHPRLDRFYDVLEASRIARRLKIGWPPFHPPSSYELVARILFDSRAAFLRRYPGGLFIVVIYPGSRETQRIVPRLREMGLPVLEHAGLIPLYEKAYHIPVDYHPSAAAHAALGARLARDLDAMGESPEANRGASGIGALPRRD